MPAHRLSPLLRTTRDSLLVVLSTVGLMSATLSLFVAAWMLQFASATQVIPTILGIAGALGVGGLAATQAWQVRVLVERRRWGLVLAADIVALMLTVVLPIAYLTPSLLGGVFLTFLWAVGVTAHVVGRHMARASLSVVSWELRTEWRRLRFRRQVFSAPRGPWHSVGLDEARVAVRQSGRDAYLEIGRYKLPVGPRLEQARELETEISQLQDRWRDEAEDRDDDRAAAEALVPNRGPDRAIATAGPALFELGTLAIAAIPTGLVIAGYWPHPIVTGSLVIVVGLRTVAWAFATRLTAASEE